jgi:hypothetical protein
MRLHEKREKELEKKRDEDFNSYRPMVPQGKEWRVMAATQTRAVKPPVGAVRPVTRRSDRVLQKCYPVSLLRSPWFVMTRVRLYIL